MSMNQPECQEEADYYTQQQEEEPMTDYTEKIKEFDEKFKCTQGGCDGSGIISYQVGEDEWEIEQCQFHAEYLFPIKSFLSESIQQAVAEERARVVGEIKNTPIYKAHTCSSENADEYRTFDNGQESYKQRVLSSLDKPLTDGEK